MADRKATKAGQSARIAVTAGAVFVGLVGIVGAAASC